MMISSKDIYKLKDRYWTPIYLFDVWLIKKNIKEYKENFVSTSFNTDVIYASKALNIKEMLRIVKKEWISLDCVSVWEIYTALKVKFPTEKIYFHWNNKTYDDIIFALKHKVWTIVVDNFWELELLNQLATKRKQKVNILIRLNVGVSAHTHKYIVTAHIDSKFWVLFGSEEFEKMMNIINNSKYIQFLWFHSHIWSQIFDLLAFKEALKKLISYCKSFKEPLILNLWWWFAVHYTDEDAPIPPTEISKKLINFTEELIQKNWVKIAKLCIEPWRSIVWEAGSTLYTIWYIKKTPSKEYYFIDGWMTDNIRPALYQAKYDADVIWKENLPKSKTVTIAGKCCESWDIIIEDCPIQKADSWDLLIIHTTWAYGYSMASNYNKAPIPAVVFIENGKSKLVVKKQSYKEIIEREV